MRRLRRCAVLVVSGLVVGTVPAVAQFGGIFGDPPRPPGNVPVRRPGPPPSDDRFAPPLQQQPDLQPAPSAEPVAPLGGIQSQTLPPPPGVSDQRAAAPPAPLPGPQPASAPAQPQLRGTAPVDTSPQPGDEVVIAPPTQKIVNPTAVFRGLDKITGRITSFDVAINETVQFGALQVTPRVCYTRPPTEPANTDAFVEVDEVTLQGEVKRIFTGWMFAASPGLHAVEHPIYDVWLTGCKGGGPPPAPVAEAQPTPPPRAPARPPARQAPPRTRGSAH
jgi:hypothetical protein